MKRGEIKMKSFLVFLCAMALALGMAGNANALIWEDPVALPGTLSQGFVRVDYDYTHATPLDFEVPKDIVNSATIDVTVGWIDTLGDDYLTVESLSLPLDVPSADTTYTLDVGTLFTSWAVGTPINCTLSILEDELSAGLPLKNCKT